MQHDFVGSPVAEQDYGPIIGTPFKVFLENGADARPDKATGKLVTEIVDLPGLIASILQARVLHPRKLSGDDLKYIRSALHLRSIEVADILEVSPEHYSRCEAETKTLSSSSEKFYRMHVYLEAFCKNTVIQAQLSKKKKEESNAECADDPEKAKEALEAFRRIFTEMKLEHIFDAEDELEFSFTRRVKMHITACGKDDGKWRENILAA